MKDIVIKPHSQEALPPKLQAEIDFELSMLGIEPRESKTAVAVTKTMIDSNLAAGTNLVRKINILCGDKFREMTADEFMLELRLIDQNNPQMTVKQFMQEAE